MQFIEWQELLTAIVTRKQEIIKSLEVLSRQEAMVKTDIQRVENNILAIQKDREELLVKEVVSVALFKKYRSDLAFADAAFRQRNKALEDIQKQITSLNRELVAIRGAESDTRKKIDQGFGKVVYLNERQR